MSFMFTYDAININILGHIIVNKHLYDCKYPILGQQYTAM